MTVFDKRFHNLTEKQSDRRKYLTLIYGVFALAMFLHHIVVTICYREISTGADFLPITWIVFAVCSVLLGRMWEDKSFWILLVLLILRTLRIDTGEEGAQEVRNTVFLVGLYAYFGCYAAGRAIGIHKLKGFLMLFCALWTIAMTVFSCLGIYVGWTGNAIENLGTSPICVQYARLFPVYHPVEAGILSSISIAVAIVGFFVSRHSAHPKLAWLYCPAMILIFIFGMLTSTRACLVINAVEIAAVICLIVYERIKNRGKQENSPQRNRLIAAAMILLLVILTAALIALQSLFLPMLIQIRNQSGILVSNALAEETQAVSSFQIEARDFSMENGMDGLLNGRVVIWENTLQAIGQKPMILLSGESSNHPIEIVNNIREAQGLYRVSHTHNMFLQTLLENGIPGLLLYAAFILLFLRNAYKVIRNRELPFWKRIVPLPALACLCGELIDITTSTVNDRPQMTLLYLFIGFTAVIAGCQECQGDGSVGSVRGRTNEARR